MIVASKYKGKNIGVFGFGKSGTSAVKSVVAGGANVFAWDDNDDARDHLWNNFKVDNLHISKPENWKWGNLEAVVLSPGIPTVYPKPHYVASMARSLHVPIICDVEIFYEHSNRAKLIGVTGTNGKSTICALLHHTLKNLKQDVHLGGNFGMPILQTENLSDETFVVIEMSSFQLELVKKTKFKVAALANISPDHLDRYENMQQYVAAKMNIFARQDATDYAVIGVDDRYTKEIYHKMVSSTPQKITRACGDDPLPNGVFVQRGSLVNSTDPDNEQLYDFDNFKNLEGIHNQQNAAIVTAILLNLGFDFYDICAAMKNFAGLAHRLQEIGKIQNVTFINDSKATNSGAAIQALNTFENSYVIMGGVDKENDPAKLLAHFDKVKKVYLIGKSAQNFAAAFDGKIDYEISGDLKTATKNAFSDALSSYEESYVLLAPACASQDQFKNFEERGLAFKNIYEELAV